MRKIILVSLFAILFTSCWDYGRRQVVEPIKKVWGYRPLFTEDTSLLRIQSEPPRTMKNPGKIYVMGNYLFQNDIGYGIHVIDNTVPAQARPVGFIKVNGSSEMSITGNYMYVNSFDNLVVLNVSNWQQVQVIKRIPNAFQQGLSAGGSTYYFIPPPEHGVYYDCTLFNYRPGILQSGWVRDSILSYCYYK